MAMPAASSLPKRYTAGGCVLGVEWQISALSQWYPKPVAQALRFKLWMNSDQDEAAAGLVLVAEGDRAALQEISYYTSLKVQGLLAIAHLNSTDRSTELQAPSQPLSLRLTHPLSYLQLCDLSSVLNQCEQATAALPTTLSVQPTTQQANNVIPFTTLRRAMRRQPVAWASSAAAALLAVGLTTALWRPGYQPSYQTSSVPNTDISGATPKAATGAEPSPAADSASPSALSSSASSSSNLPSSAPSDKPRNSQLAVKQPNTNKTTIAAPSQNAATSQTKPSGESPRESQIEPSPESAARLQAKAPAISPEIAGVPPAPARTSDASPEPPSSNQAQEPSAAQSTRPRASSSVLEAAPPPAAESATPRTSRRSLSTAPNANTAAGDATSTPAGAAAISSTAERVTADQAEATTINQVQRYFQTKWQESGVALAEPLSYSVQLSKKGKVVSFAALSSTAEAYRDRLLPTNAPLVFSTGSSSTSSSAQASAGLALRLDILPNGQVQVTKI